jgi:hypothetical protein
LIQASDQSIADELVLSKATVKTHVRNVYGKVQTSREFTTMPCRAGERCARIQGTPDNNGNFSCEMPRWGRSHERNRDQNYSVDDRAKIYVCVGGIP